MKRKLSFLAIVLVVLMCFLTIGAFAADDSGNSQMPFVDSDQITPEHPDVQTETDLIEEFEETFGDMGGGMIFCFISMMLGSILFFPSLVIMIVFIILNSNIKKKVREYERFFGPMSNNSPRYYNPNMNNMAYQSQPVNPTGTPMGTAPAGNPYVPQNDINNQQGGSF